MIARSHKLVLLIPHPKTHASRCFAVCSEGEWHGVYRRSKRFNIPARLAAFTKENIFNLYHRHSSWVGNLTILCLPASLQPANLERQRRQVDVSAADDDADVFAREKIRLAQQSSDRDR